VVGAKEATGRSRQCTRREASRAAAQAWVVLQAAALARAVVKAAVARGVLRAAVVAARGVVLAAGFEAEVGLLAVRAIAAEVASAHQNQIRLPIRTP